MSYKNIDNLKAKLNEIDKTLDNLSELMVLAERSMDRVLYKTLKKEIQELEKEHKKNIEDYLSQGVE